jgi:hypothetical protein
MPSKAPVPRLAGCSRTDLPRGSPPATDCAAEGGLGARYARGDSVFMRRKLEAVKRELRTRGKVADRESYRPPSRKTARLGW